MRDENDPPDDEDGPPEPGKAISSGARDDEITSGSMPPLIPVTATVSVVAPHYLNSLPYIQRERMTWADFCAHCETQGLPEPTLSQWADTFELTDAELSEMQALRDATDNAPAGLRELDGHFFVRKFGNKPRVCWRQADGRLGQMSEHDFKTAYGEMRLQVGETKDGKPVFRPLVEVWLRHRSTPRFDRVEFLPGQRPWQVPEGTFNLWSGWPVGLERERDKRPRLLGDVDEPDDEFDGDDEPPQCELFLAHLHDNVCGGDHVIYEWLLGWMADGLCRPGPSEVAVVMTGPSGSGKGTFAHLYGEFFGPHFFAANRPEQIEGKFNRHLMETQLLYGDEVDFGRGEAANKRLRNLVTEPTLPIEPKGVDAFHARKWFRIMISTNDEHAVGALQDDRRYLVLRVDAGVHNKDRPYFAAIRREWESGGKVALFRWLTGRSWREHLTNGGWDVGRRPVTAALQTQKVLSLSPADQFVLGALEDGCLPGARPGNSRAPRDTVLSQSLFDAMRAHSPRLRDESDQRLSKVLERWGCTRWRSGGERGWTFPRLAEMRADWGDRIGEHGWADDDAEWHDGRTPF